MSSVYSVLSRLESLILEKQRTGGLAVALIEGEAQRSARVSLGDYIATIVRTGSASGAGARIGVMFIQTGPNEFLAIGSGDAQVTFSTDKSGPPIVGIESIDEEFFENGSWVPRRRLNGDENSQGQALKIYATDLTQGKIYRVHLYRYR